MISEKYIMIIFLCNIKQNTEFCMLAYCHFDPAKWLSLRQLEESDTSQFVLPKKNKPGLDKSEKLLQAACKISVC